MYSTFSWLYVVYNNMYLGFGLELVAYTQIYFYYNIKYM